MYKKIRASLRTNVITGVLVLAPIGAVLWIVLWLWQFFIGIVELIPIPLHPRAFLNLENPFALKVVDGLTTLVILILIVFIIWSVGLVSRNYIGDRLIKAISKFFSRLPLLSTVYSTLEQLLKTFAADKSKNFRRVVYVEYPRKGIFTLALVTGERDLQFAGQSKKMLNIFIPTTPNPTSGFYLTVGADEVQETNLSVEQALKEIISMGIVHAERSK